MNDSDKYLNYLKQPQIIDLFINVLNSKETFSQYDPRELNETAKIDVASLALWKLMDKIVPFKNYILENFYDRKKYEEDKEFSKEPQKFVDCNKDTYLAAKKWLTKNKGKYKVSFNRDSYF
jgi:hypothetical protein